MQNDRSIEFLGMKRIVYPQRGSGSVRATISARHVIVKYKPSERFLLQLQNGRKLGFQDENQKPGSAGTWDTNTPDVPNVPKISDKPNSPPKEHFNCLQLPRLRAFRDGVEAPRGAALSSMHENTKPSEGSSYVACSKGQSQAPAGRSAYEELQARWRRK